MAETYRTINTRMWSDNWIRKLNALDRYLFIYLLTNEHVNWCGIYELEIGMMAFECGIDKEDLQKTMLPRLEPKIVYTDGWVFIKNFARYHTGGENARKGREAAFDALPERIKAKISQISEKNGLESNPLEGAPPFASAFAFASASASTFTSEREDPSIEKSIKYLKNIPKEEINELTERFIASEDEIKNKGESLYLYCKSKAKTYKDYRSFLLNAIKKDFKERSSEVSKYSSVKTNIAQT